MSELILKYEQLDSTRREELMDFLDFLLLRQKSKKSPNKDSYLTDIMQVSTWNKSDLEAWERELKLAVL